MKRFVGLMALVVVSSLLVGCGQDNVAACKAWRPPACGTDTGSLNGCDNYANTTCDLQPLFSCLSDAYVCVNGHYDMTVFNQKAPSCFSKNTCN
jgi:hypothetical protein